METANVNGVNLEYEVRGSGEPTEKSTLLLFESNKDAIKQTIYQGEHARFLASIGFERDVDVSSEIDAVPVLPVLRDGRLVLEEN